MTKTSVRPFTSVGKGSRQRWEILLDDANRLRAEAERLGSAALDVLADLKMQEVFQAEEFGGPL